MNVEDFREFCLSLQGVTEKMPFLSVKDPYSREVLCFYVGSKWFCYVNIEVFDRCCVRSTPDEALELRARYDGVRPAWHMNKKFWNDVYFQSDVPDDVICQLVKRSHDLIVSKLTRKEREELFGA
ncbi:MAG: MmcQ/YjbR family DNA-binding protein [Muribaculaceae bacterium]|nr:MmcQ/YjbR family DNA-binding protein [Muribaculaceae bacterium]